MAREASPRRAGGRYRRFVFFAASRAVDLRAIAETGALIPGDARAVRLAVVPVAVLGAARGVAFALPSGVPRAGVRAAFGAVRKAGVFRAGVAGVFADDGLRAGAGSAAVSGAFRGARVPTLRRGERVSRPAFSSTSATASSSDSVSTALRSGSVALMLPCFTYGP